ncbi:phage repressor protein [Rhodovulum sp. BSW8]|nr:phage repressor protein [Rhodovulum sp. BSW8]
MTEDPFIAGLRAVFEADPELRPATVSAKAGLDKSTIRRMFEGAIQSPRRATSLKIADALGLSIEEIVNGTATASGGRTVAIAGKVGAGARVPVFDAYEKGDGPQVECPPGLSPHGVVAVEIEGDSMEPVYSAGDLLFYTRWSAESVPSDVVGKRCVCECEEGLGWVKLIREGREPGLFDLHSFNDQTPPMYGVRLKWAAQIKLHWPAELARKVDG